MVPRDAGLEQAPEQALEPKRVNFKHEIWP